MWGEGKGVWWGMVHVGVRGRGCGARGSEGGRGRIW